MGIAKEREGCFDSLRRGRLASHFSVGIVCRNCIFQANCILEQVKAKIVLFRIIVVRVDENQRNTWYS